MGRLRTPTNVLQLRGADKTNGSRMKRQAREHEPDVEEPIGDPPDYLDEDVKACWRELVKGSYPGTTSAADRQYMEYGATLLRDLRAAKWQVHPSLLGRFEQFLGRFGMTPADRSRVGAVLKMKQHGDDPLNEFTTPRSRKA